MSLSQCVTDDIPFCLFTYCAASSSTARAIHNRASTRRRQRDSGKTGGVQKLAAGRRRHGEIMANVLIARIGQTLTTFLRHLVPIGGIFGRSWHPVTALVVYWLESVLLVLATAAGAVPAVLLGGPWITAAAGTGTLLVIYLALLVRRGRHEVERAQKVRYLTPIRAPRPSVVVIGSGAAR